MSEIDNAAGLSQSSNEGDITSGDITYVTSGGPTETVSKNIQHGAAATESAEDTSEPVTNVAEKVKEPKKSEAKSEAKAETKEEEAPEKWASQFEKLSKRDSDIRAREHAIKEKEAEIAQLQSLRKIAREQGELEAIKALGWSPDKILKQMANNGRPDPNDEIAELRQEIKSLREESTRGITQVELKRNAESWDKEFASLVQNDEYKIVREWDGAQDLIYSNVMQHYNQTGELLHPKQELDRLASGLKERLRKLGYAVDEDVTKKTESAKDTKPKDTPKTSPGLKTVNPKLGAAASNTRRFFDDEDAEMARISAKYS